jgi:carbonic anhydrase
MKVSRINTITISSILLTALLLLPMSSHAKMRNTNKVLAGTPPFEITKGILSANKKAVNSYIETNKNFAPFITWLTDPDPRIQPQQISEKPVGNIYTCTNMGSQLELSLGQIDYGVRYLHTPVLLITLNSDNQAIRHFMEGYGNLPLSVRTDLDHLNLPLLKGSKKGKFQERLLKNVEANVDYQVDQATARYRDRINLGRLTVVGTVIDFNNIYKRGKGRLIIINLNGERDEKKIRHSQELKAIGSQAGKLSIGRYRSKMMPNKSSKP